MISVFYPVHINAQPYFTCKTVPVDPAFAPSSTPKLALRSLTKHGRGLTKRSGINCQSPYQLPTQIVAHSLLHFDVTVSIDNMVGDRQEKSIGVLHIICFVSSWFFLPTLPLPAIKHPTDDPFATADVDRFNHNTWLGPLSAILRSDSSEVVNSIIGQLTGRFYP